MSNHVIAKKSNVLEQESKYGQPKGRTRVSVLREISQI